MLFNQQLAVERRSWKKILKTPSNQVQYNADDIIRQIEDYVEVYF